MLGGRGEGDARRGERGRVIVMLGGRGERVMLGGEGGGG